MNSLWFRLIVAFAVVVMLGAMLVTLISLLVAMNKVDDLDFRGEFLQETGPIDSLTNYYETVGSWDGVIEVLAGIQSIYQPSETGVITFSFNDADGTELFNRHLQPEDREQYQGESFDEIFDIVVEDEVRGQVRVQAFYSEDVYLRFDLGIIFSDWLQDSWWQLAITGALVGLLFGAFMGRTLTAPLRRLSEAANEIGSRNLDSRVAVRGSTEVKQLARAFNEMASDLQQAENLRRNLVADVAHELRTPLTVLQGNLRAILDDVYPLSKTEVASLYDQTRMLSRLVNDLHELSQAEARKLPMTKRRLDLGQLVDRLAQTFIPVAEEQSIDLVINIDGSLPIYADETRIGQVINNLLKNAHNHTPKDGTIYVKGYSSGDTACIQVKDTGVGIAPEHLPLVFERFYRADRSRSRDKGGAGLGLAVSKAIIDNHSGHIQVESEGLAGKGTIFTVCLPRLTPQTVDEQQEDLESLQLIP